MRYLTYDDFYELVKSLSNSQGFYSRLLHFLDNIDTEQQEKISNIIDDQHFKNTIDIILWLES